MLGRREEYAALLKSRVREVPDSAASATEPMDSSRLASELQAASAESSLAGRVSLLEEELSVAKAEISALKAHIFCAERILEDQSQLQFYTGFSSKKMFMACFNFLKLSMESSVSWQGQRTKPAVERHCLKPGLERKLSAINKFFSCLYVCAVLYHLKT